VVKFFTSDGKFSFVKVGTQLVVLVALVGISVKRAGGDKGIPVTFGSVKSGTVVGKAPTSGSTWTGTFTPASSVPSNTTYTFTAIGSDAAGNSTTSAGTAKQIQ